MKSIATNLWYSSPSSVYGSLRKYLQTDNTDRNSAEWVTIKKGYGSGVELFVDESAFSGWSSMIEGNYDKLLLDTLMEQTNGIEGKVLWDVGAHFGYSSLVFAQMTGSQGQVVSFEPNPHNAERFNMHVQRNNFLSDRIQLKQLALSNKNGTTSFSISANVEGSQSTGSHLSGILAAKETEEYNRFAFHDIDIQTIRGDDLLLKENLPYPDIIKIDVEGAEKLVLEGCPTILSKRPVLLIEIHNVVAMHDTVSILHRNGYKSEIIDRDSATLSRCFIIASHT